MKRRNLLTTMASPHTADSTEYSSRGVTGDSRPSHYSDQREGFEEDDDDEDGQAGDGRSESGAFHGEEWHDDEEDEYEDERGNGRHGGALRREPQSSGYSREESRAYESDDA